MIPRLSPDIKLSEFSENFLKTATVADFENAFAELSSSKFAIAFPYGRTAIYCLLKALGLHRKKILCPAFTCVVVPHAITFSENLPVFVDCMQDSFLMDLNLAMEASSFDKQIGAIISTPLYGQPVPLDLLAHFKRKYPHIHVIQDCAHSFFCESNGTSIHKEGIAAVYGLNFGKILTSVFGGMITTDNEQLFHKIKSVRRELIEPHTLAKSLRRRFYYIAGLSGLSNSIYGPAKKLENIGLLDQFTRYYSEDKIDMPDDYLMALTPFEANVGLRQCKKYYDRIKARRNVAMLYDHYLKDHSNIKKPCIETGHTYSHYTILVDHRDKYINAAATVGVELGVVPGYLIPELKAYNGHEFYRNGSSESFSSKIINLPVHERVDEKTVKLIAECLRD
jgi:dTDP-4-amino-4,6-dideoxygalactose transaminase